MIDLLERKATRFVLWAPKDTAHAPELILGEFAPGTPPKLSGPRRFPLTRAAGVSGLWEVDAANCGLIDGHVYHYWFEVDDTAPGRAGHRIQVCDPMAFATDWRLLAPRMGPPYSDDDRQPTAVAKFVGGRLAPCDAGGEEVTVPAAPRLDTLPPNNQLVVYELPTAWVRKPRGGGVERGVGTFKDVQALVDLTAEGANFSDVSVTSWDPPYLVRLGVNAIELAPPQDSFFDREWGYGTSHFCAPDYELGFPEGFSWPTPNADLRALVEALHQRGIRMFVDVVMGFARQGPYEHVDFDNFHIVFDPKNPPADPDAWSSRRGRVRYDWGSRLFRYARMVRTYDPVEGADADLSPARRYLLAHLFRWMRDFHVDGFRLDSIETVYNWDFIREFSRSAREQWHERWNAQGLGAGADARFLVVGEELELPITLIREGYVNALWNDKFREYIRPALLGRNTNNESTFEWTVRKAIDCRGFGFRDGAEVVNYLTSHDVEGEAKERLHTFFLYSNFSDDEIERRIRLAFVCLLTAVGIPMILAGEEFADQHDLFDQHGHVTNAGGKQVDPVNFSRLDDADHPIHRRVFEYVCRLVRLRTSHASLGVNECNFIHVDFTPGRRILVWQRGPDSNPVVVVTNFSDWGTADPGSASAEYRVPNWPRPGGKHWYEVTQDRDVPDDWVGREPVFPWEAKVYVLRGSY